jgi:hypothetical protein
MYLKIEDSQQTLLLEDDDQEILLKEAKKKSPIFLYERIVDCITFLNEKKNFFNCTTRVKVSNEHDTLKKLLPFNILSKWAITLGVYPTLKYIDNYISHNIILQVAKLNEILLTKTNFLTEFLTQLTAQAQNIDNCYSDCSWQKLISSYSISLNFNGCIGFIEKNIPEIKVDCFNSYRCKFINSTAEVCSYAQTIGINYPKEICNHFTDRMCYWVSQDEIVTFLQSEINYLNQQTASLHHYIPDSAIGGITATLGVGTGLATAYYAYSYYKYSQWLSEFNELKTKLVTKGSSKQIKELKSVCDKLKIKDPLDQPIQNIINELEKHAKALFERREKRDLAYTFFEKIKMPREITQKIFEYAELGPADTYLKFL